MGKGLKLKSRFRRGSLTFGSNKDGTEKSGSKKVRSKAAGGTGEIDDFEYSEDVYSDASENDDEFFHKTSRNRFGLERTWSVNAFQISSHSAGNVYMDESDSDENDSDGSSSYESFGSTGSDDNDDLYMTDDSDNEADNSAAKVANKSNGKKTTKKKKGGFVSPKSQSPMQKYRKQARKRDFAPAAIPEGDEDDEFEDISENESDDNSAPGYATPAALANRTKFDQFSNASENFESGYSSDSALVRKRMAMMQQQQETARKKEDPAQSSNEGKKKKGGKKKQSSKKKEKKKGNKNRNNVSSAQGGGGSLEGDSTVTTISVESDEEGSPSIETKVEKKGGKKKKKKKKKNGKEGKDGKKKKKRVISFVVDGDDEACADFDKRLEEIEQFEAALVEERKLIQKERETMAFERESMEMRLDEETHHCDELKSRIRELEQLVQSQKLSNAGDDAESIDEKQSLKLDFAREKRKFHVQLVEKEREIDRLELAMRDIKLSQGSTQNGEGSSLDSNNGDGKSRERLQGELLQSVSKLSEQEAQLRSQGIELKLTREQLASLKKSGGGSELKRLLAASQEDRKRLQQELEFERNENTTKLKDKDETVSFLMNELANLKKTKGR